MYYFLVKPYNLFSVIITFYFILGVYMLFQMFSIASVMLFGAIVVNLYHHTRDTFTVSII